jgi:hypothetical protein
MAQSVPENRLQALQIPVICQNALSRERDRFASKSGSQGALQCHVKIRATSLMENMMPIPVLPSRRELETRPDRGVQGPAEEPFLSVHFRTAREGALKDGSVSALSAFAGCS